MSCQSDPKLDSEIVPLSEPISPKGLRNGSVPVRIQTSACRIIFNQSYGLKTSLVVGQIFL